MSKAAIFIAIALIIVTYSQLSSTAAQIATKLDNAFNTTVAVADK